MKQMKNSERISGENYESRREYYGFGKKQMNVMDYVFWILCFIAVVLIAVVLFSYLL